MQKAGFDNPVYQKLGQFEQAALRSGSTDEIFENYNLDRPVIPLCVRLPATPAKSRREPDC